MKPPPARGAGAGGGTLRRSGSLLLSAEYKPQAPAPQACPAEPEPELRLFVRRECRKCPAAVWEVTYFAIDGDELGWGLWPIGKCTNPRRCGEQYVGLGDEPSLLNLSAAGEA